jgi:hypothetical protein
MKVRVGVLCGAMMVASCAYGQAKSAPVAAPMTEQQMADTQEQLIKLLRVSPVLTEVVERDPSLLADQAYVSRTNPQLAEFLTMHPEVARNPEFYLFNGIEGGHGGRRHEVLDRKVWPEMGRREEGTFLQMVQQTLVPFLVFLCILCALIWLLKVFMENRRWSRAVQLQVEAHNRLIERFSSNQELLVYMETDAGKKFLQSGPVPLDFQPEKIPSLIGRVLRPLQIGIVMTLLGAGFLTLRNSIAHDGRIPFLVFGTMILMPGLGFIISAALTWLLAGRLGMIPDQSAAATRDRA